MTFVVTCNAGSSSLKAGIFSWPARRRLSQISFDRIGRPDSTIEVRMTGRRTRRWSEKIATPADAAHRLAAELGRDGFHRRECRGVIHRVVYGGRHDRPIAISGAVLRELRRVSDRAPLHIPAALAVVASMRRRYPRVKQIASFDTLLSRQLPDIARTYAIDARVARRFRLVRLGYHGFSHSGAARQAAAQLGRPLKKLRLLSVHLGSGCSVTAFDRGRAVETSMGMTPLEGLVMGTRAGDLDPGIVTALWKAGKSTAAIDDLLEHRSGLLGVSGYSSDMRDILTAAGWPVRGYRSRHRPSAAQRSASRLALQLFVRSARKYLLTFADRLGVVQAIVFTGAIGEHNADIRRMIMTRLSLPGDPRVLAVATSEETEMIRQAGSLLS